MLSHVIPLCIYGDKWNPSQTSTSGKSRLTFVIIILNG